MAWPKLTELAILTVNGQNYQDWETVLVRHSIYDTPWYHCRFTCSEGMPLSKNIGVLQIKPGDVCTVTLAGKPAFTGFVETRQVFYDAHRHHIEIQCASGVDVLTSSVVSPTMERKNVTFEQVAREELSKLGKKLVVEGGAIPAIKFPRVSATHGESVHDYLDTLARVLSSKTGMGIGFTSNPQGDFVVVVGPSGTGDVVIEGVNIIEGREIIYNPSMAGLSPHISQAPGSDSKHGASVISEPFFSLAYETLGKKFNPETFIAEIPTADKKVLEGRANSERGWLQADQITVFATVYGWLNAAGELWRRDMPISVVSPMLMMKGNEKLRLKSVTFTQDDRTGTRTVLECCNDAAIGQFTPTVNPSQ